MEAVRHWRDRILILGLVLMILGPSLLYAWGAAGTARQIARRDALAGNLATAQLGAGLIDAQCTTVRAVLGSLAERRTLMEALARRSRAQPLGQSGRTKDPLIQRHLHDAVELVPDIAQVAAYDPRGRLMGAYSSPGLPALAPRAAGHDWFEQCRRRKGAYISNVHRLGGPRGVPVVSLAVPVGSGARPLGYLVAPFRLEVFYDWLQPLRLSSGSVLYVVDRQGRVVAGSGEPARRWTSLASYAPVRRALAGNAGSTVVRYSPVLQTTALTAYAPAAVPGWGVVVSQSEAAALAAADQVWRRFSLLLVPLLALMLGAAWLMERLHSRQARLARENLALSHSLAAQNEQLRAADRAKSDFLANVSHNLRTPLASIKASVSGLLEPDIEWDQESLRGFLKLVHEEVDRLAAEVRNLLHMTRIEAHTLSMQPEICDLAEIVDSALERVEPLTQGWEVEVERPPEPLLVEADYTQIETVILNLLENAMKYTPPGSTLHLRMEGGGPTAGEVAGMALFTLRDAGPGVPPEDQERIFEKFYRGQAGGGVPGTGLGLAICRAIIAAHGGRIGVRPAPGGGAEFWFALAMLAPAAEEEDESGPDSSGG